MIRFVIAVVMLSSAARATPKLMETEIYRAHGNCRPVNLATWHHPTKKVLDDAKVTLLSLDMCDQTFPIFHVSTEYTPFLKATDSFYMPFYARMWVANGKNPMAIDIANWHDIVDLRHDGKGLTEVDEDYVH